MKRNRKSVDAEARVDGNGAITGYASTFTREPDWAGDVVAKGAFAEWLDAYKAGGTTLPLLYNHDQHLDSYIGKVTSITEDDHGLLFTAEFDATEKAQQQGRRGRHQTGHRAAAGRARRRGRRRP